MGKVDVLVEKYATDKGEQSVAVFTGEFHDGAVRFVFVFDFGVGVEVFERSAVKACAKWFWGNVACNDEFELFEVGVVNHAVVCECVLL